MGIVIAAGNSMKLWLAADGRCAVRDPQGELVVYEEDLPKVRRVTDQILVGYAGDSAVCTAAIDQGMDFVRLIGAAESADMLAAGCELAIRKDQGDPLVDAQIVVVGLTSSGAFGIYAIRRIGGQVSESRGRMESPHVCQFAVLSEEPGDTAWADEIMGSSPAVEENLHACIRAAADRSPLVNDHITVLSLER